MAPSGTLRLVILTGRDSPATCSIVASLTRHPEAQVVGIMLDTGRVSLRIRLHKLRRSIRRQGWSYLVYRIGKAATGQLERLAARVVSSDEVAALFAKVFPGQALNLDQLGTQHGIPVFAVDNLNSASTAEIVRSLAPDLGIVLGTRILKRATFSVPRFGCLNMHLGKVPEYRGTPPGFWELYDGQRTAGVTLHFVDDGLDTGHVLAEETVPIHDRDTPETLRRRLEARGRELLVRCVADFARGRVTPRPQPSGRWPARTSPTRRERKELEQRLQTARGRHAPWIHAVKTTWYLLLYYTGLVHLVRVARRITGRSRACVLLYHRVNDLGDDPLTASVRGFVEHMVFLHKHAVVIPSAVLVEKVKAGHSFPRNTVAIHFDDCYRDVFTHARPVLAALNLPAAVFVSSGYVSTQRRFLHDAESPWVFDNLSIKELQELAASGVEVGSHTVNHIDLGQTSDEMISAELIKSKQDLEGIARRPVRLFTYPYGRETNTRPGVVELVQQAGYRAMFSAYGGYVSPRSNVFDLPRISVSGDWRPLDLLMEIEGLSLGALRRWWRGTRRSREDPSAPCVPGPTPVPSTRDAGLIREEELI